MKKIAFTLSFLPLIAVAQSGQIDSADYYLKEMNKMYKEKITEVVKSEEYQRLERQRMAVLRKTNNYTGLVLYSEIAHSNYTDFNNVLVQDGFSPLKNISTRLGFGISHKRGHTMLDMNFACVGFSNDTKKGNEKIRTNFSSLLQFDLGYDLLNMERLSIYPFGGFSLRSSFLKYTKPGDANPAYSSLANMYTDENNTSLESFRLGYQYGIGLDFAAFYNKSRSVKTILFTKFGVNRPFKQDTYKDKGVPAYKPNIKQGDWVISIGVKFGNKR